MSGNLQELCRHYRLDGGTPRLVINQGDFADAIAFLIKGEHLSIRLDNADFAVNKQVERIAFVAFFKQRFLGRVSHLASDIAEPL